MNWMISNYTWTKIKKSLICDYCIYRTNLTSAFIWTKPSINIGFWLHMDQTIKKSWSCPYHSESLFSGYTWTKVSRNIQFWLLRPLKRSDLRFTLCVIIWCDWCLNLQSGLEGNQPQLCSSIHYVHFFSFNAFRQWLTANNLMWMAKCRTG